MRAIPAWAETTMIVIGGVSAVLFVASLFALPWLIRRLPADYFVRESRRRRGPATIARDAVAIVLIVLGAAMLVLPGQGVITILLGLSLLDLPIKKRAIAWLLRRPKIEETVRRVRERAGKPPLLVPQVAH